MFGISGTRAVCIYSSNGNPDGVDLVLNGLNRSNPYYNSLLQWNQTGKPFSEVWNANMRCGLKPQLSG